MSCLMTTRLEKITYTHTCHLSKKHHPLSACECVRQKRERERNSLRVSGRVHHSVVSLRDICLHVCLRHYGRQTMSSYTQRRAPSVRPYQSNANTSHALQYFNYASARERQSDSTRVRFKQMGNTNGQK